MKIQSGEQLSQNEMIKRFSSLIKTKGRIYRKISKIYARPGVIGEKIDTVVKSGLETSVIVKEKQIVIKNRTEAQEEYVVNLDKFKVRYRKIKEEIPESLKGQGFEAYQAVGRVFALKAGDVMDCTETFFEASWKELMRCLPEDMLAIPLKTTEEVYRIAYEEFLETYALEKR